MPVKPDAHQADGLSHGERGQHCPHTQALQAAQEELTSYLERLLAAAGLEAEKIQAAADIGEDGSIVCTGVSAWFRYPSDGERAWALLRGVLGEEIRIEVMTDGA